MYIKRDVSGEIERVSREALTDCDEPIASDSPELLAFLGRDPAHLTDEFHQSDLAFVRVLDDLIYLLMDKGVFSFTDLPEPAQQKLLSRQSLRKRRNSIGLMSDGDNEII
ncbi:tryptophan synthase subunit beta like protein [Halomonas sp. MCCC 1A11036]|uniref:Tryptophan synthase subunit beta like protein n=1 Tax=Billgrantia zhangzhouensis TaxID=2733481 RepID=A0ABS9AAY1_9GAMM|nr:tryptophan synthase subunit beta like protein [Halomonas zhangzhouensis]MCE8018869.1 tryptophan synthase subunit beta like protein [Halomonas zhangzhouensis]